MGSDEQRKITPMFTLLSWGDDNVSVFWGLKGEERGEREGEGKWRKKDERWIELTKEKGYIKRRG